MTSAIPVQRSNQLSYQTNWEPFKPEFFQVSSFQPLRLKHLHCDDLHIILSLSAVQIYEFHILMFIIINTRGQIENRPIVNTRFAGRK